MLFDFDIVIPAGTLEISPIERRVRLTFGKLTQIRLLFPPGPATLVYIVVRHELHQLMPANYEGNINFDDEIIVSNLDYDLLDSPYELTILGWSPLAVYEHTITCQFDVQPIDGQTWEQFNSILFNVNNQIRRR